MSRAAAARPEAPLISVVVVVVSDTTGGGGTLHLERSLDALRRQVDPPAFEVVVAHPPGLPGVEELARRFPEATFVRAEGLRGFTGRGGSREHHDELRARGLATARGEIVGLLEDHAVPDPHWCARVAQAHREDVAAVGGAIENGVDRPLAWAVYFCDFGRYQNPLPPGAPATVSDANVAYKRPALQAVRPVWQDSFREPAVNAALRAAGQRLALAPEVVVYQHRDDLRLRSAVAERFIWGRSYAAARAGGTGLSRRATYVALSPLLPGVLLLRMIRNVLRRGRCRGAFAKALPLTALLTASWSAGELIGYLSGSAGSSRAS
ncbi:MAG: hypothetical protein ABR599_03155 [Gemmatimonadota bacterium]